MDLSAIKGWQNFIESEITKPYFQNIISLLNIAEQERQIIYPPKDLIFNALQLCSFENTKVIILGQDPYHGYNQAHGLSFSVPNNVAIPPSLKNIYKEIKFDYPAYNIPENGNLENWAKQGVLLLNAIMTVAANQPLSHSNIGWQQFTDALIQYLNIHKSNLVFMLWGKFACSKASLIDNSKHKILQSGHPSFAAVHKKFFHNQHFKTCNEYLITHHKTPINW